MNAKVPALTTFVAATMLAASPAGSQTPGGATPSPSPS